MMEKLVSPWRLPPTISGEALTLLRRILEARLRGDAGLAAAFQPLSSGVLEELRRLELTPWLYSIIARYGLQEVVAASVLEAWRADCVRALQTSALETQETLQVVKSLGEAGVAAIFIKGADLRLRLYGSAAARPMADLDLLILPEQVPAAHEALAQMGFRLQDQCADPRPGFRLRFRRELHFEPPPAWPLMVDLHWQIDYPDHYYPLPVSRLSQQAVFLELPGGRVKVLSPEHAYLLLLMHACDGYHGLMQLVDFTLAPPGLHLDWERFLGEVIRFRCQAPVYLVLREIARLVPETAPAWIWPRLSGYSPTWLERLVLRRHLGGFTSHLVTLYRHPALRDRLFYLAAVLWPQTSYLKAVYGNLSRAQCFRRMLKQQAS